MSRPLSPESAAARAAGLAPATVAARIRARWPESLWYARKGTRRPIVAPPFPLENPGLWEDLDARRAKVEGLSAAALSRAIGKHPAWWSQQRARGIDLAPDVVARIEAAIKKAAGNVVRSAMPVAL